MYTLTEDRFEHKAGAVVYLYKGHDYGLSRDDTVLTGKEHTTVTLDPEGGSLFFTCPLEILKDTRGCTQKCKPLTKEPISLSQGTSTITLTPAPITVADALYGFVTWLTIRKDMLVLGAAHESTPVAHALALFCKTNNIPLPSDHYPHNIQVPKV